MAIGGIVSIIAVSKTNGSCEKIFLLLTKKHIVNIKKIIFLDWENSKFIFFSKKLKIFG